MEPQIHQVLIRNEPAKSCNLKMEVPSK